MATVSVDRSPLGQYLQKTAAGDMSCIDKLCVQLADRLVFVPVVETQKGSGGQMTVSVYREDTESGSRCFLFTNEKKFKDWASNQPDSISQISLLGADFCAALPEETMVVIDVEQPNSVTLIPEYVTRIARVPMADDEDAADELSRVVEPLVQTRDVLDQIPQAALEPQDWAPAMAPEEVVDQVQAELIAAESMVAELVTDEPAVEDAISLAERMGVGADPARMIDEEVMEVAPPMIESAMPPQVLGGNVDAAPIISLTKVYVEPQVDSVADEVSQGSAGEGAAMSASEVAEGGAAESPADESDPSNANSDARLVQSEDGWLRPVSDGEDEPKPLMTENPEIISTVSLQPSADAAESSDDDVKSEKRGSLFSFLRSTKLL